jgi:protein-S-isoprenylcysteine O-methyltransferase Ste14
MNHSDNPGVRVPPPLVYLGAVVGGWLLDRALPLPIGRGAWLTVGAWLLVAAWAVLGGSSIGLFRRKGTSMLPFRPASALVITGPYRFTRNPMYVALALLTIALALFLNTWWIVVLLIPALLTVQRFVIVREEGYLRRRFGADYDEYALRVGRWL